MKIATTVTVRSRTASRRKDDARQGDKKPGDGGVEKEERGREQKWDGLTHVWPAVRFARLLLMQRSGACRQTATKARRGTSLRRDGTEATSRDNGGKGDGVGQVQRNT